MSKKDDISRRKVLASAGGLGGAVAGVPGITAAADGDSRDLTREEVRQALAEMAVRPSNSDPLSSDGVEFNQTPSGMDIYVGQYKNAQTPTGKPFAIESYDEYLARNAPPGFESGGGQLSSTSIDSTDFGTDYFYLQEDVGAITLEGYTFNVGVGAGVQISGSSALDLSATLSVDVYIDNVSFALTSFTVGYGVTDKGFCLGPFNVKYSVLRGLEVELCGTAGLTGIGGDEIELTFGPSLTLCADPCPGFTCAYCKSVSAAFTETVDNPI